MAGDKEDMEGRLAGAGTYTSCTRVQCPSGIPKCCGRNILFVK